MSNPLCVWDFTLSVRKSTNDENLIIKELSQIAKKWTFQLENAKFSENDEKSNFSLFSENSQNSQFSQGGSLEDETSQISDFSLFSQGDTLDDEYDEYSADISEFSDISEISQGSTLDDTNSQYSNFSDISQGSTLDNGYLHWQGRISLFKKKRKRELIDLLSENDFFLSLAHFSPTCNNTMGDVFYCMKLDTRERGPWSDTDEKPIEIPRQIKMIDELYPWQQEILDRSQYNWDNRFINVLYDPQGCSGKSTLAMYAACHKLGRMIPSLNNYLDIMQCVMSMPISKLYFIDMPRAINKTKLNEFYAGIEMIKNGFCFDIRYKYAEKYFDSPSIWIFSNKLPDENLLSRDRWKIWMTEENELYLYPNYEKGPPINYPVEELDETIEVEDETTEVDNISLSSETTKVNCLAEGELPVPPEN